MLRSRICSRHADPENPSRLAATSDTSFHFRLEGEPKGVAIRHAASATILRAWSNGTSFQQRSRLSSVRFHFDLSVHDCSRAGAQGPACTSPRQRFGRARFIHPSHDSRVGFASPRSATA